MEHVDQEIVTQQRVIDWLHRELGYRYLGDLRHEENTPVKTDLLRAYLKKCNYGKKEREAAIQSLVRATKEDAPLYTVNQKVYEKLRYGVQVKNADGRCVTVHFFQWADVEWNDFAVAEEVTVLAHDGHQHKRPDLVLYVNGIALAVFELKRSSVSLGEGIRQLLQNQKKENIRSFFSTAQLLFAGNEAQGLRYGTIETPEKYFLTWKEDEKAQDDLSFRVRAQAETNNLLRKGVLSLCHKERLLSLVHDFVIFDAGVKKVARHNQYFAHLAAQARIRAHEGGIIWNTQGSGKSLIMVWLAQWIREHVDDSRVVIITDREELDEQIAGVFHDAGENHVRRAKSCADLRDVLNDTKEHIICSLIHKYGHNAGKQSDIDAYSKELVKDLPDGFRAKGNIVAFIDECHRTNSGKLHKAVQLLMPDAILIGFTGTPLLRKDKKTSLEIFGTYIHTYKFDEAVEDGVILDLRYEARDVDQTLTNEGKIDAWFDHKTRGLTKEAQQKLKQRWTTMRHLFSTKGRLEKIAQDIIFDMEMKPRLKSDRGTAMLVAGSIYEACRYWEIFQQMGFSRCAVVTSYEPKQSAVRTATSDLAKKSEEEYIKDIYERMLAGETPSDFETHVKRQFRKEPAQMKLLIVVDKLLTGFDAPSATYLYIDKKMRDHDLFQSICRVNRPDGEDKDYGYIVDYKDLFRSVQKAVSDYTSEALGGFDREDVEGLVKGRLEEAVAAMQNAREMLAALLEMVPEPREDADIIAYYCQDGDEAQLAERRAPFYQAVSTFSRSFANCCDQLVESYGYPEDEVAAIRQEIKGYQDIKTMIQLACGDNVDFRAYEPDMRYLLDAYVDAEESRTLSTFEEMPLIELIVKRRSTTPAEMVLDLPGSDRAKEAAITNNLRHEITKKIKGANRAYYEKMSRMLAQLIRQRRADALSYEEYLRQVAEMAQAVLHPEDSGDYPKSIRASEACRAWYDRYDHDVSLALDIDEAIRAARQPMWHDNFAKRQKIRRYVQSALARHDCSEEEVEQMTDDILQVAERMAEYDA